MNVKDLIRKFGKNKILILSEELLPEILNLENVRICQVDETNISDKIRILKIDQEIIIQEITLNHELCLRKMKNLLDAKSLVQERLNTYEKMWDGCGCKVEYYH